MLVQLDTWLLSKFEAFSHWWQRLTGKDCFWLARVCLLGYVSGGLLLAFLRRYMSGRGLNTWPVFGAFLFALFFLLVHVEIKRTKERTEASPSLANTEKVTGLHIRIIALVIALFSLARDVGQIFFLPDFFLVSLFLSLWYFLACNPLPPAPSKVKKWLEQAKESVGSIFVPSPVPQPIPIRVPSM